MFFVLFICFCFCLISPRCEQTSNKILIITLSADCLPGHWGPTCGQLCGQCGGNGRCHPVTGVCQSQVCLNGWTSAQCDQSESVSVSTWLWWCRASCPRMSVDILGTNCDQCTVQCCFTSMETIRLIRTESPGRPPRLSHSSWTLWMCPLVYIYMLKLHEVKTALYIYIAQF